MRRTRLTDLLLLALRLAIVAAAVLGLAQPFFATDARRRTASSVIARAIVVDTSASMVRLTPSGERAVDEARREAVRLAGESGISVVVETAAPRSAIAGTVAWLGLQHGTRELFVVSDFQLGALVQDDVARLPSDVSSRFRQVLIDSAAVRLETRTPASGGAVIARVALGADRTDVEWTREPVAQRDSAGALLLLTAAGDRAGADAARRAAAMVDAPPFHRPDRPVAIVFPGFAGRDVLMREARTIDKPWMADVVVRLRRDAQLRASQPESAFTTAVAHIDGQERLVLFSPAVAGSVESAALIAAVARALAPYANPAELEPATLAADTLRAWERTAGAPATIRSASSESDGRWLWLAALALLVLESLVRRTKRSSPVDAELHAAAS